MIKRISRTLTTYLTKRNYNLFVNFVVNNPTTGKPCA